MSILHFEEETKDLSDFEKNKIVVIVTNLLSDAKGIDNMTSSKQLLDALAMRGIKSNDQRIRKIIQHIRKKHILRGLIATSKGYYLSTSPKEIRDYAHKSYGSRINEMAEVQREILADADYFEGI